MKSNVMQRLYKVNKPLEGSLKFGSQPGTLEIGLGLLGSKSNLGLYVLNSVNTYMGGIARYGAGFLGAVQKHFSLTDLFGADAYTCFKKGQKKLRKTPKKANRKSNNGSKKDGPISKRRKREMQRETDESAQQKRLGKN
jgi:hypothetical protein